MKRQRTILPLFLALSMSINSCIPALAPEPTNTPQPTKTETIIPTETNTPMPTFTPTPVIQTLGRVFPEEFHGQAVWSNATGDTPSDTGWRNFDNNYVIHFDVDLPVNGFTNNDLVLAPADGVVTKIYSLREEGECIQVQLLNEISGIENIFSNSEEIEFLETDQFTFSHTLDELRNVSFHFGHIVPLVEEGTLIKKGETVAKISFDVPFTPKLAYVIILEFTDGTTYQFSPCLVDNDAEFCGVCAVNTPYRCP